MPTLRSRLTIVLVASLLAMACKSSVQKRVSIPKSLSASALIVYPFGYRWEEPAYRSFELAQRLIGLAEARVGRKVLLFGPGEFRLYRDTGNTWSETDAAMLLPPNDLRPEQVLILRPWAEKRVQIAQREITSAEGKQERPLRASETTYIGHIEVYHPSSGDQLVEVSGEQMVDPRFRSPESEFDPAPQLTQLMERLLGEALAILERHLAPPRAPRVLELTFAFNGKAALAYFDDVRPALDLRSMDPLTAMVLEMGRVQYLNPTLPLELADKLPTLPAGLFVLSTPKGSAISPGDIITEIGDDAALPQRFWRLRFAKEPVRLRFRHANGESSEALLP